MNTMIKRAGLALLALLVVANAVLADGTIDRDYGLGDDSFEGASLGAIVGSGNNFDLTFDSQGTVGFGDLQDLEVFGGPTYATVNDRPLFTGSLGVAFDGTDDYLRGPNLNLPDSSAASFNHDDSPTGTSPPGPLNYVGIVDRYFQFWAKPDPASSGVTQSLVMDTNQHGVRIDGGEWSMRYGGQDVGSGVAVNFDDWSHIMVARPFGAAGGSRLYVNGIAVAAAPGGYNGAATEELVVGSTTGRDGDLNFTGGDAEFYHGLLDNLTMSVLGDNTSDGGQDWGSFAFQSDNEFAADAINGVAIADVNMDGVVSGNGTGPANSDDVTAFVSGWRSRNELNGVLVGDLSTRMAGDLDFSGQVDLLDFSILNLADPSMGAAVAQALNAPEPRGLASGLLVFALLLVRRKQ